MTHPGTDYDQQLVTREALSWIFRLHSGEMTGEDADALLRWRAAHPAHAEALGEAVKLRRRLAGAGRKIAAEDKTAGLARPVPARAAPIGRRAFIGGAIAASAGAVAVLNPPLDLWPSLAAMRADYRTGTGERRAVTVAPNLSVELNTRTSLARRDDAAAHRFALIEGEVAVDAAHPLLPVAIQTEAGEVLARDARFGVRRVVDGTCITCLAGTVAVRDRQQRGTTLAPGERVTFDGGAPLTVAKIDPARAEAWRRGLLVFNGEGLGEVIAEINRYRPGRIILTNAALDRFPITGTFQLARLDRAVAQIEQVAGADARRLPGGVVLLG